MSSYNCAFYNDSPTRLSIRKMAVRLDRQHAERQRLCRPWRD